MAYEPPEYGIQPPPFMPYEPFLLGVGVVFNLLNITWAPNLDAQIAKSQSQRSQVAVCRLGDVLGGSSGDSFLTF